MTLHVLALSDLSTDCQMGYPEACTDKACVGYDHMPERDDAPPWTADLDELSLLHEEARYEAGRPD